MAKNSVFGNFDSSISDTLANLRPMSVELLCAYEFRELFKNLSVCTSYRLYLVFQSRGERLTVSARGTMFNSLLRLRDSRPFLFDPQE